MVDLQAKLALVRRGLPATEKVAFLNAGSYGPLTAVAGDIIAQRAREEAEEGRLGQQQFDRVRGERILLRAAFSRVLGCAERDVALTSSTTGGMNLALWGIDWRPGDEIVTTDIEHFGGLMPLYILQQRFGVRVRYAATGLR
ncbi:MAG: aminotransferase class V-fold PLP-dependent enzyme, partial [Dehalococcoidia bacterium]